MDRQTEEASHAARQNVRTIAELEQQLKQSRPRTEKIAEWIGSFAGRVLFVFLHLTFFLVWVLWNSGKIPGQRPFDPYPFILLALIVSCEGVLLTTFVLIKQNRMAQSSDRRDHLDLQIDILAEQELTRVLYILKRICERLDIRDVEEPMNQEVAGRRTVRNLAEEVHRNLNEE